MRLPRLPRVAVSLALCVSAACAASAPTNRSKEDITLITREQIQELRFSTAYDAVKGLRSNWITNRGPESFRYPSEVQVYLDGVHMGGVATLQDIASPPIQSIRFISGIEATSRWGTDHGKGVIFVSTRVARDGAPATQPPNTDH